MTATEYQLRFDGSRELTRDIVHASDTVYCVDVDEYRLRAESYRLHDGAWYADEGLRDKLAWDNDLEVIEDWLRLHNKWTEVYVSSEEFGGDYLCLVWESPERATEAIRERIDSYCGFNVDVDAIADEVVEYIRDNDLLECEYCSNEYAGNSDAVDSFPVDEYEDQIELSTLMEGIGNKLSDTSPARIAELLKEQKETCVQCEGLTRKRSVATAELVYIGSASGAPDSVFEDCAITTYVPNCLERDDAMVDRLVDDSNKQFGFLTWSVRDAIKQSLHPTWSDDAVVGPYPEAGQRMLVAVRVNVELVPCEYPTFETYTQHGIWHYVLSDESLQDAVDHVLGEKGGNTLEIDGDQLITDQGVSVDINAVREVAPLILRILDSGRSWKRNGEAIDVDGNQLEAITSDGMVIVGCHRFSRETIEDIAQQLGMRDSE